MKAITQGWKQRHLSPGGKEVLLKAVALSMSIYSMNIFRLPKEVCEAINGILARFWWGSGENKGMHWYAWKRVCTPKREGGLGFRDLEVFNQALLGKQVWRILQNPTCLMARVLKARYFPDGCILSATLKKKSSYAWKSILYGKELITKGMRYIVGDGSLINMWSDPWIPDHPPRSPIPRAGTVTEMKVNQFFDTNGTGWDIQKLRDAVIEDDIDRILKIKISRMAIQDLVGWHYNDDGLYTVKSGYWLGTHLPIPHPIQPTYGHVPLKQKIWKTKTPPKIQHFMWKLLSRSLAVGDNLRRRHITRDDQCKRCGLHVETEKHLFFDCQYAQCVWRASGISNTVINSPLTTFEEKIEACLSICSAPSLEHFKDLPLWILWRLWKSRNILVFQRKQIEWRHSLQYAKLDAQEWKGTINQDSISPLQQRQQRSTQTRMNKWQRPLTGWIKCNTDGSFVSNNSASVAGWVLRDEKGVYQGSVQAIGQHVENAYESELQAVLMAIQHCWMKGYRKLHMEGDNKKVIDVLNNRKLQFSAYNWTREIHWWAKKFTDIKFTWTGREANKVADRLAKARLPDNCSFQFNFYVPSCVTNLLHEDYVNSF